MEKRHPLEKRISLEMKAAVALLGLLLVPLVSAGTGGVYVLAWGNTADIGPAPSFVDAQGNQKQLSEVRSFAAVPFGYFFSSATANESRVVSLFLISFPEKIVTQHFSFESSVPSDVLYSDIFRLISAAISKGMGSWTNCSSYGSPRWFLVFRLAAC